MNDRLTNERVEKRFLVPAKLAGTLDASLPGFEEHFPINEDGDHNAVTQNIYFGRDQVLNKNGLIRARRYLAKPQADVLTIADSDPVFLEIKYKVEDLIKKGRIKTSYEMVRLLMMEPLQLREHLLHSKGWNLSKDEIDTLLGEFYFLQLYPQFAIQYVRRHFHPQDPGVDCRITLDNDLSYFAFSEESAHSATLMGKEGLSKMEVKYAPEIEGFAHALISLIVEQGAVPIGTLQPKVESLYQETAKLFGFSKNPLYRESHVQSDPLHSVQNVELINEFPDTELEFKLQVQPVNAELLAKTVFSHLQAGLFGQFRLIEGKEDISFWTYYFDNYGYETEEGLQQAYVIVHHPDKPKFIIRTKANHNSVDLTPDAQVMQRPEEGVTIPRPYVDSDKDTVGALFEMRLGKPMKFLGTNKRTKFYFFLEHPVSHRYYNFAVDQNRNGETEMAQVEIEYKGKLPTSTAPNSQDEVKAEIAELAELLKTIPFFELSPTTMTKFDWLKGIADVR